MKQFYHQLFSAFIILMLTGATVMAETKRTHENEITAKYGVPVVMGEHTLVKYPDFSLQYAGFENRSPKETTVSIWVSIYSVKPQTGPARTVEITAGQLPPRPNDFEVDGKSYTLCIFALPNGKRLGNGEIVVLKGALDKPKETDDGVRLRPSAL